MTTTYALDLNTGLTQVLSDGTNTYLYGNGRIAQMTGVDFTYFLGDALGSVRQLTDANGAVTLTKGYEPYGEVLYSQGSSASSYGHTGEWLDETGLTFLRARYYSGATGRFISQDTWSGDNKTPLSYNLWLYAYANPIRFVDSGGNRPAECFPMDWCDQIAYKDKYPIITGYSEKTPPRNITWLTNKYADLVHQRLAPLFDQNNKLVVRTKGAQFMIKNEPGSNYCGDVVLSAVLRLFEPIITSEWVVHNNNYRYESGATSHTHLANFVNERFKEDLYASTVFDLKRDGLDRVLRDWIRSGVLVMPLVTIISGRSGNVEGGKVGNGVPTHWVLVTGISAQWKFSDKKVSSWNWIRIFNPFNNAPEYYWWEDFLGAWEKGSDIGSKISAVLLTPQRMGK